MFLKYAHHAKSEQILHLSANLFSEQRLWNIENITKEQILDLTIKMCCDQKVCTDLESAGHKDNKYVSEICTPCKEWTDFTSERKSVLRTKTMKYFKYDRSTDLVQVFKSYMRSVRWTFWQTNVKSAPPSGCRTDSMSHFKPVPMAERAVQWVVQWSVQWASPLSSRTPTIPSPLRNYTTLFLVVRYLNLFWPTLTLTFIFTFTFTFTFTYERTTYFTA